MISELKRFVCEIENASAEEVQLEPLAGDASTRRFFRVRFSRHIPYETAILMWLPELPPEGEPPFINVRRHLAQAGVPVPQIYHFSKQQQCLLLEDFGDCLLEQAVRKKEETDVLRLYTLALEEIFKMQFLASKPNPDCVAFSLAFDEEKLAWELNFFLEHTLRGWLGAKFTAAEAKTVQAFFSTLARFLAKQPRVFTHRDYHSRNLLVQDGKIKVIDFQDARMGPGVYDLVSLLDDAYVELPRLVRHELLIHYIDAQKERLKRKFSEEEFIQVYDWMKLQRSLKAAGTFGFMAKVRENRRYLPYLPRVFQLARKVLNKYPEFKSAKKILDRIFHESDDFSGGAGNPAVAAHPGTA